MIDDIYQYIFKVLTFIFIIVSVQFLLEKNRFMNVVKFCCFFIAFFLLHYLEGLPQLGAFSFAQIWKIPLMLFLFLKVISACRRYKNFERIGYLYSFEPFLCPAIVTNPFSIILFATKQLPVILFFNFWQLFSSIRLERYLMWFAQFISLASLLTLLKIVEPLKAYQEAEYLVEGGEYYSSVFGSAHAASSYFVVSSVVLFFFIIKNRINTNIAKLFNIVLLIVSLYSLYLCYIRTGWLMLLVSVICIFDYKRLTLRKKLVLFICSVLIALGTIHLWNSSEVFRIRLSGSTKYNYSEQIVDTKGSGRVDFWEEGIKQWSQNDVYSLLFGKGFDAVREDNYKAFGMEVFSHNLFVDSLCQYGLLSLIFLVLYNLYLFRFIQRYYEIALYGKLCLSLYLGGLIFNIFQSEVYFNYAIAFSLSMVLMYKTASMDSSRNGENILKLNFNNNEKLLVTDSQYEELKVEAEKQ